MKDTKRVAIFRFVFLALILYFRRVCFYQMLPFVVSGVTENQGRVVPRSFRSKRTCTGITVGRALYNGQVGQHEFSYLLRAIRAVVPISPARFPVSFDGKATRACNNHSVPPPPIRCCRYVTIIVVPMQSRFARTRLSSGHD